MKIKFWKRTSENLSAKVKFDLMIQFIKEKLPLKGFYLVLLAFPLFTADLFWISHPNKRKEISETWDVSIKKEALQKVETTQCESAGLICHTFLFPPVPYTSPIRYPTPCNVPISHPLQIRNACWTRASLAVSFFMWQGQSGAAVK